MGAIYTYIVKIMWDPENPHQLHGLLTCVATGEKHPFTSSKGLLDLLTNLPSMLPTAQPDHPDSDNPQEAGE